MRRGSRKGGACRGSRLPATAGPAMGSRLRLCGAALAMAGGAALAAWAWARLRGRGAGRGEPPAPRLGPVPSIGVAPQGKRQGRQILVLGLDGAGKSSLLQALATNQAKRSLAPTEGFNAVCIATEESQMEFLEIGGSESLRSYWKMYLPQVLLLIYVVDSADHARLPVAKQLLHQLVENNSTLPVVVLAHKQDLEGAYCITDIHDALALSDIGDKRKMFLIGTHVAEDGSEISSSMKDAKELIAELFLEMQ